MARVVTAAVIAAVLALALLGVWGWRFAFAGLPEIPEKAALWSLNRPPGVTFLDKDGRTVGQRGPKHGQSVGLRELPAFVPQAFLAAEDRRFYQHPGVDLMGVARAVRADLGAGHVVQGGSTITQQLVKNLFLSSDQTFRRKAQEAALAWRLERRLTKTEVLELYLNRIYFGAGSYGLEAAAESYFGKSARALTLPEAALLAALPKAPTRLDPTNDLAAAIARSRLVLAAMREEGWITPAAEKAALARPPVLVPEKPFEGDLGYVLDFAQAQARALSGGKAPDLIVRLTVDSALQVEAARDVREGVAEGQALGATQAALVALAPDGAVRVLVGGVDHRASPFDRATQAMRQPGSAFKAFVYAAGFQQGMRRQSIRTDGPIRLGSWAPQNSSRGYAGPVPLSEAFARSINTVAVRVAREVGPGSVAKLARSFGLGEIPPHPDLSVALGAYEVSLLDLTAGYQVFQQAGRRAEPYLIAEIRNARGDLLYAHGPTASQVYDPALAGEMVRMMQGVVQHGTGRRADFGRPAAGKTGTSQSYRDAWFVGFTPDWVAGVWVGDDRNRPMKHMAGGDLPASIWRRFMIAAHDGLPAREFDLPPPPAPPEASEDAPAADATAIVSTEAVSPRAAARRSERREEDEQALPPQEDVPPPQSEPRRTEFYDDLATDLDRTARGGPP